MSIIIMKPEKLPGPILEALWEAARTGHVRGVAQQLIELEKLGEPYLTFARQLQELNQTFQLKQITELTEPYLKSQQPIN